MERRVTIGIPTLRDLATMTPEDAAAFAAECDAALERMRYSDGDYPESARRFVGRLAYLAGLRSASVLHLAELHAETCDYRRDWRLWPFACEDWYETEPERYDRNTTQDAAQRIARDRQRFAEAEQKFELLQFLTHAFAGQEIAS